MQTIDVWHIEVWDGGDRHNRRFTVSSESEAKKWIAANKHDLIVKQKLEIFDSYEDIMAFKNGEVRRKALEKLTDIEKKALGF